MTETSKKSLAELKTSGAEAKQLDLIVSYLAANGPTGSTDVWAAVLPDTPPESSRFATGWRLGKIRKTGGWGTSTVTGKVNELWAYVPDLAIPRRKAMREYWQNRLTDQLTKEASAAKVKSDILHKIQSLTEFIDTIEHAHAVSA